MVFCQTLARKSGLIANEVLEALKGNHLLQITTTRGKVYIGRVLLGPGIYREGKVEEIAVAPLFSGHRDPSTQEIYLDLDDSLALLHWLYMELLVRLSSSMGLIILSLLRRLQFSCILSRLRIACVD